ncbi:MAG: signal peptidase I [Dehalococcoidia bacterium]
MVQGHSVGSDSLLAGLGRTLRARETWRVASRQLLMVVSALVTLSVLAAAVPTFFGMDSFIIDGGSMRPAVPAGALVVAKRVDPAAVQPGDIITFRHSTSPDTPVTHRVVKVLREADGTTNLLTKGDANSTADPEPVATDLPVSRMVYSLPYAGYVLEFSRTTAGKGTLIVVPALLLLLSIGRSSKSHEASEAATPVPAPTKVADMVSANSAQPIPASALERLAQAPAAPAPRPGLMRRLAAAFSDDTPPAPAPAAFEAPAPVAPPANVSPMPAAAPMQAPMQAQAYAQQQPQQQPAAPQYAAPYAPPAAYQQPAYQQPAYAQPTYAQPAYQQPSYTQPSYVAYPPPAFAPAQAAAQPAQPAMAQPAMAQPATEPMSPPMAAPNVAQAMAQASAARVFEGVVDPDGGSSLLHLTRLRLRSVARLGDIMRTFNQVETEAAPLLNLVTDLDQVRRRFAHNLDEAMRPLAEFADRWDENLVQLQQRMEGELPQQIDLNAERRRIAELRAQIPERHSRLLDQFEIEKQAIDAALTVFDDQVAKLETQLTAARRTAEVIGDSMRTADFARTVEFLRRRTETLALLAERGAATPEDISDALPPASVLAADDEEMLANSPYLASVIAILEDEGATEEPRRAGWGAA